MAPPPLFLARCCGTRNIDETLRLRVRHDLGIGGRFLVQGPGPASACGWRGVADPGPQRIGSCWLRAIGQARHGFSVLKTGNIFWRTGNLHSRIRK